MSTTSHLTSFLAKPVGEEKISKRALGYVSEMAREDVFDLVASACVEAGVTRSQLCKRLQKDPAQVSRLLGAPGNWTIDTIAEFLFAIDGSMLRATRYFPLEQSISNSRHSPCLESLNQTEALYKDGAENYAKKSASQGSALVAGGARW